MKQPAIDDAKALAKKYGAEGVVVFAFDFSGSRYAFASYGATKALCELVGKVANAIYKYIPKIHLYPSPGGPKP